MGDQIFIVRPSAVPTQICDAGMESCPLGSAVTGFGSSGNPTCTDVEDNIDYSLSLTHDDINNYVYPKVPIPDLKDFSLTGFFKTTAVGKAQFLISYDSPGTGNSNDLIIGLLTSGNIQVWLQTIETPFNPSPVNLFDNNWHFFAL